MAWSTCQPAVQLPQHCSQTTTAACRLSADRPLGCLQIDAAFEDCEAIQALPRLVYALLRSPLLSICPGQHPDARASLQQLWTCLQPLELCRAVYPLLSSYMSPDTEASTAWAGRYTLLDTHAAAARLFDTWLSQAQRTKREWTCCRSPWLWCACVCDGFTF